MIAKGGSSASKFYLGSSEVTKIYKGDTLVYSSAPVPLPYDAEVEYLETDGVAYINTGIVPANITPILETRTYLPTSSSSKYVVGSDGSGNTRFSIGRLSSSRIEFRIGSYKNVSGKAADWYVIKLNGSNGQASLNGVVQWTSGTLAFHTMPILLFTSYGASAPRNSFIAGMKISYCKIWDNETLVADYIPVRVGQVGYFYDRVTRALKGNAAESGAFVLGADVSS